MKNILLYFFVLLFIGVKSQQTIVYTQNAFNKAGLNPAASGTEINRKLYYCFGANRQWFGFDNSPKQNFVNVSYTIRPQRSYRFWQNVGVYVDDDQGGLIGNQGVYGNYTLHLLVQKKLVLSFGAYLGTRKYTRSLTTSFDNRDPALTKNSASVLLYPDFIPGFRIENKKFFAGFSARQITINKLKDFKGKKIGSPSKILPSLFFDYGKYMSIANQVLMMPSVTLNVPVIAPPIVDLNVMFYLGNRIGLGAGLRNISFASGIFQIRFLENITVGFAYSYPINQTRFTGVNSYEIMIGVVPMAMNFKATGGHSIAKCPLLNF